MPMSRAARWFCATARIARPSRVQRNKAPSASMSASEAPMMPSDPGATRIGPTVRGRLEKNEGNGNSSWVQTIPAAERDDQHVEVRGGDRVADDQALEDEAEERRGQDRHEQRDDQRRPENLERGPAHERRDHQHLALREVERARRVKDDHEAQRHQRVDRPGGEPADDDVDQGRPGHEATKRQADAPIATHAVSTTVDGRPKVASASDSRTPRIRWHTGAEAGPYASATAEWCTLTTS